MKKGNIVAVVALILSIVAIGMNLIGIGSKSQLSVEEALMKNPEVIVNAMKNYEEKKREEALAQYQKAIDENIEALTNDPNSGVMGNPSGKIVLVEFFDFSCGYCHRLFPAIKSLIAKNPDLKVITKELAFVSPFSDYAGRAALTAKEQGKYKEMYDALFSYEGQLNEVKIDEIAGKIGLNMEKFKADVNSDKIKGFMKANNELAGKVQVSGVPTMVLNGKMLQTIDEATIQEAINKAK